MIAPASRQPSGFALVETLVALTVLSFGLASSVAALVQGLRHERESAARTAALRLAVSLGEELRALRRPDGRAVLAVTGAPPAIGCAEDPAGCTVETAAAQLIAAWHRELAACLPAGARATVDVPDDAAAVYHLSIAWPAAGAQADSSLRLVVET